RSERRSRTREPSGAHQPQVLNTTEQFGIVKQRELLRLAQAAQSLLFQQVQLALASAFDQRMAGPMARPRHADRQCIQRWIGEYMWDIGPVPSLVLRRIALGGRQLFRHLGFFGNAEQVVMTRRNDQ